jgi:hypothetical protein
MKLLSVVLQEYKLFPFTQKVNIIFGKTSEFK